MIEYIFILLAHFFNLISSQTVAISKQPNNVTVANGDAAVLQCTIENLPISNFYVQWVALRHSQGTFPDVTGYREAIESNVTGKYRTAIKDVYWVGDPSIGEYFLSLEKVTWQVFGGKKFECQVLVFPSDMLRSRIATVTVEVPPQSLNILPHAPGGVIRAPYGDVVNLTCVAANSYPPVDLQWSVDGVIHNDIQTTHISTDIVNDNNQHLYNSTSTFVYHAPNNTKTKLECFAHFGDDLKLSNSYLVTSEPEVKLGVYPIYNASEEGVKLYIAIGCGIGAVLVCVIVFLAYKNCNMRIDGNVPDIDVKLSDTNPRDNEFKHSARSNDYISMSPCATPAIDISKQPARSRSSHSCSCHESVSHVGSDNMIVLPPAIPEDYSYSLQNAGFGVVQNRLSQPSSNRSHSHSAPSCAGACCRGQPPCVQCMYPHTALPPPVPSLCSCDISENLPPIPPPMMPICTDMYGTIGRQETSGTLV